MYNKNKRGPKTEPWGTPIGNSLIFDFSPFN